MAGRLIGIARRGKPLQPMVEIAAGDIRMTGLEGDARSAAAPEDRAVTVLFEEEWRQVQQAVGQPLPWTDRRANLLLAGLANPGTTRQRIGIGAGAVLEVTGECSPCSRMDRVLPGLRARLEDGPGGLTCRVIAAGPIARGDAVVVAPLAAEAAPEMAAMAAMAEMAAMERAARPDVDERPAGILRFWFEELSPSQHFRADPELDAEIRRRFLALHRQAVAGELDVWAGWAEGALALLLVLDQFSRNLFRGEARAFAADSSALAVAGRAIERGFDTATAPERRRFFYLPYMHSEDLADQDRCLALFRQHFPDEEMGLYHAGKHREVIARFGRFPYRNAALGRTPTEAEESWLAAGGYTP